MQPSRTGRLPSRIYLLMVLAAVTTWVVADLASAPDDVLLTGFFTTVTLTFPLGYAAFGVAATAGNFTGDDGTWAAAVCIVLVFLGAAAVNVITWRWSCGRRRNRQLRRQGA